MSSSPPRGVVNSIGNNTPPSPPSTTASSSSAISSTSSVGQHRSGSSNNPANPALGSYLGQLAAAQHIRRLVERYLTLAPVFIGGPSNTSLELPPGAAPQNGSKPDNAQKLHPNQVCFMSSPPAAKYGLVVKLPVLIAYFPVLALGILGKGVLFVTQPLEDRLTGLTGSSTRQLIKASYLATSCHVYAFNLMAIA